MPPEKVVAMSFIDVLAVVGAIGLFVTKTSVEALIRKCPKLAALCEDYSVVSHAEVAAQLQTWSRNHVRMPSWLAVRNLRHPRACLRHNHRNGGGCTKERCTFDHVCLVCGARDHGAFAAAPDGRLRCADHIRLVFECIMLLPPGTVKISEAARGVSEDMAVRVIAPMINFLGGLRPQPPKLPSPIVSPAALPCAECDDPHGDAFCLECGRIFCAPCARRVHVAVRGCKGSEELWAAARKLAPREIAASNRRPRADRTAAGCGGRE